MFDIRHIVEPELAILYTSELLSSNNVNEPHGLFNNKYPLHIIPHSTKKNTFTNRISYNTQNDSYYENGIIDKKYLEFWDKGALYYENLRYMTQHSYDGRTRDTTALFSHNKPSSIIYKFDYSSYKNLGISLLKLRLENNNCNWVISISTDKNNSNLVSSVSTTSKPSIKWIRIKKFDKNIFSEDLTYYVKNKKFFYIKMEMSWGERNAQLFSSTKIKQNIFENNNSNDIEKISTFDVIVELSSSLLMSTSNLEKSFKNLNFISTNSCDVEKGKSSRNIVNNNKNKLGGLFNDKYRFNVLQSKEKKDIYTHRISYHIFRDAYYENGNYDIKYLKRWNRGTFAHNNIYYKSELLYSHGIDIDRTLSHDEKYLPAYITWKFDYRIGNLYLSSLNLKLNLSDTEKTKWLIQSLPTRKNPNPVFKSIDLLQRKEKNLNSGGLNFDCYIIDLTEIVKNEYGFILKAYLNEIKTYNNYRLFSVNDVNDQGSYNCVFGSEPPAIIKDDEEGFCMDIKIELKPNMICDLINDNIKVIDENLLFNDKDTSDFIIKLELPKENNDDITEKFFYTHTKILSSRSDYFHALLNSNMLESRNGYLKLNDISYHILERLLLFIYTDNIENTNEIEIDDWIDLLYASSKFLLPKLFQICELSIKNLINFDNVENIEKVAYDCCSTQLLKFCEMFEVKSENEKNEKDKKEIIDKPTNTVSIVEKFKNWIKNLNG